LSVGEAKTTPSELLSENMVLLLEVGDHVLLSSVDPTGKGKEEKLQGGRWGFHESESAPWATSSARGRGTFGTGTKIGGLNVWTQ
jgi:hypothetical protein